MYSPGNAFVVYEIKRHVYAMVSEIAITSERLRNNTFPTAPSPVTTHCYRVNENIRILVREEATLSDFVGGAAAILTIGVIQSSEH